MSALSDVEPVWPDPLPIPDEPLRVAMIGAGKRARWTYLPVLAKLSPWVDLVAVCDPARDAADDYAARIGGRAYYDLAALVADRPMEACVVVTPATMQYAVNMYLIEHGVHAHTETPWGNLVCQARGMVEAARAQGVVIRVGENFFRTPIDRFAQTVRDSGYLGRIGRIISYADHTGYHNNSRWIRFAGCHPDWLQCLDHGMDVTPMLRNGNRVAREDFGARFFHFPNDFLVNDITSGLGKGLLGRHARPGYTEWHGECGTLMYRATSPAWADSEAELRRVTPEAPKQEAGADAPMDSLPSGEVVDVSPLSIGLQGLEWSRVTAATSAGRIEYVNRFAEYLADVPRHEPIIGQSRKERTAIADHVVDFAAAVKGLRNSEFSPEDGLMSQMMTVGARESALQDGKRIALPIEGDLEVDAIIRGQLRETLGADPMDVEAMLALSQVNR